MTSPPPSPVTAEPISNSEKPKPFRFKRKRPHPTPDSDPGKRQHSYGRHHHHHRSRRRPRTPPTLDSDAYEPHSKWDAPPDPDVAFRESLFDALADDEGAAFWEGVYGQPVHTYSPYYPVSPCPDEDGGEPRLERMTDEEYTRYVREKMWEKSHGYIIEERRRRQEERQRRRERDGEQRAFQVQVEEALRKGEERRRKSRWEGIWVAYLRDWETRINGAGSKDKTVWPVLSGKSTDVGKEEVEKFYMHAPQAAGDGTLELLDVLKKERVRWHPDKMQQRAGPGGLDTETMKLVTAVFQTVDRMWNELKAKS